MNSKWEDLARTVAELCVKTPAAAGPAALAQALTKTAPNLAFRETLNRGGWYRLGGVVNDRGEHIADDLEKWAEEELAAHDDDLGALFDSHAGSELRATRLSGKTHYLVAATGNGAGDFLQLEIEELQEAICHPLFAGDNPPNSIEDLVDPRLDGSFAPTPLAPPFLTLRRLTDVGDFLGRMRSQKPEPQPIHRFIEAWEKSSAGAASQFSNHWVLAVREHLDRYRQTILHASPVAAVNGAPPRFDGGFGAQGLALQEALKRYDKLAGYPMAWFFHMITGKTVPHALATAVIDDVQAGFHYLPDRDAAVVKEWLYKPYAV
ncbi:MAG TPA: hypothetical protein VI279_04985 [Rhodocyclaceae bacterium]